MPSYLGEVGAIEDMTHGVNYASAGAGIIYSSGSDLVKTLNVNPSMFIFYKFYFLAKLFHDE